MADITASKGITDMHKSGEHDLGIEIPARDMDASAPDMPLEDILNNREEMIRRIIADTLKHDPGFPVRALEGMKNDYMSAPMENLREAYFFYFPSDPLTIEKQVPPVIEVAPVIAVTPDMSGLIADYARNMEVTNHIVGTNVLMPPVFDGGNFNRNIKRIRVTVEEPAGKYELFSREEFENKALYFLTASGMIDRTKEYFRDVWNDETRKWENHRPTESELDEIIPLIAERFDKDLADPVKWAKYQHAAVLNRIEECEAHNAPIRNLREEESKARKAEALRERKETERLKLVKYEARVNEIATAIGSGKAISVSFNEYEYDGKNPVLDLFKMYGIKLPLRTQGWVNSGLAEITGGGYRYLKSKHKGNSTAFSGYLNKLREAIRLMPIDEKWQ